MPAAGARILLAKLGVTDPWVHLSVGTLAGVALPLALWVVVQRLGWRWVFGLPEFVERQVTAR